MSNALERDLATVLPVPAIQVDPCVLLDDFGLWATARLQGASVREVDLYLPARRTVRRVEVGHGEDAVDQLGKNSRQRLLVALDKALARPLRLVVDARRAESSLLILDESERPLRSAVTELAVVFGACSVTVAGYAVEFSIREPERRRLALGAAKAFGAHAAWLFGQVAEPFEAIQGSSTPSPQAARPPRLAYGSSLRLARYVRTATINAMGRNTVEAQNKRINDFLAEHGLRSAYSAVDEGCNGMAGGRSGIEAVVRLARKGEIDAVVATSADRLFRSATHLDRFVAQLRSYGVSLMLVDHGFSMWNLLEPPRRPRRPRV